MSILDRYASAVRSANLKSEERTTFSDSDVLGASGLAAKQRPLAIALARLFCGDNRGGATVVEILTDMAIVRVSSQRMRIKRADCIHIARAVLAWHRNGSCKTCGGHGYSIIPGTCIIGEAECEHCHGEGRVPFDAEFRRADDLELARWLIAEIEREQGFAGSIAMQKLAPTLHIG